MKTCVSRIRRVLSASWFAGLLFLITLVEVHADGQGGRKSKCRGINDRA